jgi:dihydrofolate reductase
MMWDIINNSDDVPSLRATMTNFAYIATSLDGYIAGKDGDMDWLMSIPNPDNSDYGFSNFIEKIDAIVMGRKTFEMVHSFGEWPYTKPVFILSNTLKRLPRGYEKRAKLMKGDIKTILGNLGEFGFHDLYIDGGQVIQDFLREDLIDELFIATVSILLGRGIRLFGEMDHRLKFIHLETIVHGDHLTMTHYIRDR